MYNLSLETEITQRFLINLHGPFRRYRGHFEFTVSNSYYGMLGGE